MKEAAQFWVVGKLFIFCETKTGTKAAFLSNFAPQMIRNIMQTEKPP